MSFHFVVAIVGALVAAAGTGVLVSRCIRVPNTALIAWTIAAFALTVALGAQALGYDIGFGPIAFRAMEIGAQVLAPLALVLGAAEVAGKTVTSRFAARLLLSALTVVALVVFATDPLSAATFSKAWPSATVYYQIVPNKLLEYLLAPATVIVALIAIGTVAARPRREAAWRDALPVVGAAGVGALLLAVPGIAALLSPSLPLASLFAPLCLLAAAAAWFSGTRLRRVRFGALRQEAGEAAGDDWGPSRSWAGRSDETGDFDPVADDDEFGIYRNGSRRPPGDLGYGGTGYGDADSEAFPRPPFDHQEQDQDQYADDAEYTGERDYAGAGAEYPDEPGFRGGPPYPETASPPVPPPPSMPPPVAPAARGSKQDLFGQIAIYTLLEDRVDDFDRLTKQVVKQVRSDEPDTLVYIVHAVPSAPMQRILYEVYSDRAAYENHRRQPYVISFEADRRPFVLATNIIELGLQQAKVSPLPSVADLLGDTGFDLLSDTGFGQPGYGPRSPSGNGGAARG